MNSNYPSTNDIIENLNTLLDNLKFPKQGSINEIIKISQIRTDSTEGTKADINIKAINNEMLSVILSNFSHLISAVGNCKGDTSKDGPKNLPLWTNLGVITSNLELLLNRMNKWKDDNKDDTSVGISTITNSTNSTNSKSKSVETPIVENILESINADNDTITLKYNDSYEEHLTNSDSGDATTIVTIKKKKEEDKTHLHELSVNTFKNDAPSNHFENGKRGFIKKYLMPLYDDDYFKVKNPYATIAPQNPQKEENKEGILDYLKKFSDNLKKNILNENLKQLVLKNIEENQKPENIKEIDFLTKFPKVIIEDPDIKNRAIYNFSEEIKKENEIKRIKDKLQKAIEVHKKLTDRLKLTNPDLENSNPDLENSDNYKSQIKDSSKLTSQNSNTEYILPLDYENGKHSIYRYIYSREEEIEEKMKAMNNEQRLEEKKKILEEINKLKEDDDEKRKKKEGLMKRGLRKGELSDENYFSIEKFIKDFNSETEKKMIHLFDNGFKNIIKKPENNDDDDKNELYYVYYLHKYYSDILKENLFKNEDDYNNIDKRIKFITCIRFLDKVLGFIPQKVYGCLVVPDENYYYNLLSVDNAIKNIDKFFPKIDDYDPNNMEPEKFLKYIQGNLFPNCSSTKEKQLKFTDIEKYLEANGSLPKYKAAKTKAEKKVILEKILPENSYKDIKIIDPVCKDDIKESYYNDVITIELSKDRDNYFDFCNSLDDILIDKLYLFKQSINEKINNFDGSEVKQSNNPELIDEYISEIQLQICYFVINIAMTMIFIRSCLDEKYNNTSENGKYRISKGEQIINKKRFYRGETIWRDEEIEKKYSINQGAVSLSTNYLKKNNQLLKDLRSEFSEITGYDLLTHQMNLKKKSDSGGEKIRQEIVNKRICSYILSEVQKIVDKYFKYNEDKYVANEEEAEVYQTIFDNLGNNYSQSFHKLILSYTLETMYWVFKNNTNLELIKKTMFPSVNNKKKPYKIKTTKKQQGTKFGNHARLYLSNNNDFKKVTFFSDTSFIDTNENPNDKDVQNLDAFIKSILLNQIIYEEINLRTIK